MENFRPAGTLSQFISDLKASKKNKNSLMVWQTVKGKKHVLRGTFASLKKDKDITVVNIALEKNHSFDKESPIFLYEESNGILFKGEYSFYVNLNLKLVIDDKVFLREKRKSSRFGFHYSDVTILVKYDNKLMECNLKDVSELGYAFQVKHKLASVYKPGETIELAEVHGIKLPKTISGKIVHVGKSPHKWSKDMTIVGVKFNRKSKLFTVIAKEMGLT